MLKEGPIDWILMQNVRIEWINRADRTISQ